EFKKELKSLVKEILTSEEKTSMDNFDSYLTIFAKIYNGEEFVKLLQDFINVRITKENQKKDFASLLYRGDTISIIHSCLMCIVVNPDNAKHISYLLKILYDKVIEIYTIKAVNSMDVDNEEIKNVFQSIQNPLLKFISAKDLCYHKIKS